MDLQTKNRLKGSICNLDPRLYQIAILAGLLIYGTLRLNFDVFLGNAVAILGSALLTQYACTRMWKLPVYDPKSALISGLSLCLLLRTNSPAVAMAAASIAIASKFVLRWEGKHIFNPTNFSIVVILCTGLGWVSPGQWGREVFLAFLVACLGGLVVNRSARSDVTYALLAAYMAILLGRAQWLGDPLTIPLHQLQNGALLIFAFFMISDPKTTPNSRTGRIVFAVVISLGAAFVQFGLYRPNGLLWSLVCCAITVPLIDRLFPGKRYQWNSSTALSTSQVTRPLPVVRLARLALNPVFLIGKGHR